MRFLPLPVSAKIVRRLLKAVEFSDCWLWQGGATPFGHGRLRVNGTLYLTHRLAYRNFVGAFNESLLICHKCDVPGCIRPSHLFPGTSSVNMQDANDKGRLNPRFGEDSPRAVITERDVRVIRKLRRSHGWGRNLIANATGLSSDAIDGVLRGRSWRHVTTGEING